MNVRKLLLGGLTLLLASGCADFQQEKIEARNRYLARTAWENLEVVYEHMEFTEDFGRGFREGYYDVCNGGNGCPPVIPPRLYWSVKYASPRGHQQTHAWFEGYRYGAVVAEQDGVGIWVTLPTSTPAPREAEPFLPQLGPTPGVAEEGVELREAPAPVPATPEDAPPVPQEDLPPAPMEEPMPEVQPLVPQERVPEVPEVPEAPPEAPALPQVEPTEPKPETAEPFQLQPRTPDDEHRR